MGTVEVLVVPERRGPVDRVVQARDEVWVRRPYGVGDRA
jgi:hypothetical protein